MNCWLLVHHQETDLELGVRMSLEVNAWRVFKKKLN